VKIGRIGGTAPTLVYTFTATAIDDALYTIRVDGEGFDSADASFTADEDATRAEIHAGLVLALNSVALASLTFTDKTVSAVDATDNELDFGSAHSLVTGDGPVRLETTGSAPGGLATSTDYYVIVVDTDSISLAISRDDALVGTEIDITSAGSGTHTLVDTSTTSRPTNNYVAALPALVNPDDTFTADNTTDTFTAVAHGLLTGDGPFVVSSSGTLPAGLTAGTNYWIIRTGADTFQLATTRARAFDELEVAISDNGTGTQTIADVPGSTVRPDSPFTVTADAAGDWFSLGILPAHISRLSSEMSHVAGTLSDELQAILDEDDEWYTLITLYNSNAYVLEAAGWIEGVGRTYVVDVNDTACVTTPLSGATDTLADLLALGYARTMYAFHTRPAAMMSAAWMGRFLTSLPGKATPKFKTLQGVETVKLTSTQRANLIARRGNSYELAGGRGITFEGTVGSTLFAFFDVTRNRDWLADELRSTVFGVEVGADIVPYTPAGISAVYGAVRGVIFGIAADQGVIALDPEPVVTAPKISEVSANDKVERVLRNVKFNGTLQGAVHKVAVVGSVSF